jgi:hypothetical protein
MIRGRYNDIIKGAIDMLKDSLLSTGEKIDLNKFEFPASKFMQTSSQDCFLYDAKKFHLLSVNHHVLTSFNLSSSHELENKDIFYLEKLRQKQTNNPTIQFAHKVITDMEIALSKGSPEIYSSVNSVNIEGYCKVEPSIKIPLFRDKKITAILTIVLANTRNEHVENLYNRYKQIYKNDIKRGNSLFLAYLGLPIYNNPLSSQEIETLIALSKYRNNAHAAKSLAIAVGTIDKNINEIKTKLRDRNICDILLHFTTPDRRKF